MSISLLSSSGFDSSPDNGPEFSVLSSVSSTRSKDTVLETGSYPSAEARSAAVYFPVARESPSAASSSV